MKTKQCGVFAALAAVLLLSAALVTGCVDPIGLGDFAVPQDNQFAGAPPDGKTGFQLPDGTIVYQPAEAPGSQNKGKTTDFRPEQETDSPPLEKKGYIYLKIATPQTGVRTIMPNTGAISGIGDFTNFSVYVLKADGTAVAGGTHENEDKDYFDDPISVVPGNYTVRVFGNLAGSGAVAVGEDDIEVEEGTGGTANVTLKEIVDGKGDGTFAWDITQAATIPADTLTMTIYGLSTGTTPTTAVSTFEASLSGTKYTNTTGIALKSGYYRVEIEQEKTGHKTVKTLSILHVYQGFKSTFDNYTLPNLKPNVYTIPFNLTPSTGTLTSATVNHGDKVTKPSPNPTFAPGGDNAKVFDAWYEDSTLTTPYDFDTLVINAFPLYAKWTDVHEVTFDYNDGRTPGTTTYDTDYVVHGSTATAPTTNPTHTGGDYVGRFAGWYEDAAGTTAFVFTTVITAPKTLYAKWTPVYTVTFHYNDGEPNPTYDTQYVAHGETASKPTTDPVHRDSLLDPSFVGWYTDDDGDPPYDDTLFVFTTLITDDITLYAKWGSVTPQDVTVNIGFSGFTEGVDPVLTATANVGHKTGVSITVTLTNYTDFDSFEWYVDGYTDPTTANAPLVFDVTEILNKIVGDYEITVIASNDSGTPYSATIIIEVELEQ